MTSRHDPSEGMRSDGMITTGAQHANLSIAFHTVLERAVEHLGSIAGAHGLYVYGSVATGQARAGSSDVDLVTVDLDRPTALALATTLSTDFSGLCRAVEIGTARASDYDGPGDEAYGNRVFLRHYCVHLAGPDLRLCLPDYPADRAAARGFNGDIGMRAKAWRNALTDAADPALLARRVARKTLFAVAGLVSVHDRIWSTDRVAAAQRFGVIRPELKTSLETLIAWGSDIAAPPSRAAIRRMLEGVVAEVVEEFANRVGLWPSQGSKPAN